MNRFALVLVVATVTGAIGQPLNCNATTKGKIALGVNAAPVYHTHRTVRTIFDRVRVQRNRSTLCEAEAARAYVKTEPARATVQNSTVGAAGPHPGGEMSAACRPCFHLMQLLLAVVAAVKWSRLLAAAGHRSYFEAREQWLRMLGPLVQGGAVADGVRYQGR